MDKLSRNGHRQRMRQSYISGGADSMHDHNILELYLSLVIVQKDVKPLAYELINTFGSLENVMNASVEELMTVNGIGECTAVALSLVKDINRRIANNRNNGVKNISSSDAAISYFYNLLAELTTERLAFMTLDNSNNIIASHSLQSGSVNSAEINVRKITELVLRDNASSVIVAHNHPLGNASPSGNDINFTLELRNFLNRMNIELVDHIIIGSSSKPSYSMRSDPKYCEYFSTNMRRQNVANRSDGYNIRKLYMDELKKQENND